MNLKKVIERISAAIPKLLANSCLLSILALTFPYLFLPAYSTDYDVLGESDFFDLVQETEGENDMLDAPLDRMLSRAFSYCEPSLDPVFFLNHPDNECTLYFTYLTYLIYLDAKPPVLRGLADSLVKNVLEHPDKNIKIMSAYTLQGMAHDDYVMESLVQVFFQIEDQDVQEALLLAVTSNHQDRPSVILFLVEVIEKSSSDKIQNRSADVIYSVLESYPGIAGSEILEGLTSISEKADIHPYAALKVWLSLHDMGKLADEDIARRLESLLTRRGEVELLEQLLPAVTNFSDGLRKISGNWLELDRSQAIVSTLYKRIEELQIEDSVTDRYKKEMEQILEDFENERNALIVRSVQAWFAGNWAYWLVHPLFWLALIFAYPYFPQVQATFFWNKHVRDILGLWYVGMVLRSIPPLRQRLFAPFRESLLADAKLDVFATHPYFPDSEIQLKGSQKRQPLLTAIPAIKGQLILEGESGLGKTMLLRHLVNRSKRLTVFLPAYKCESGVIEAIQAKLHGQAQDADFLRHLIYSGALDICIDGLNEVRAEVRANIASFVESYFKGNIVMTTQPLVWNPPATAKTYVIQPLRRDQVQQFLTVIEPACADIPDNQETYAKNCFHFLDQALSPDQPPEDMAIAQRILSNPMDLSIVAQILAKGIIPELFQLQQQQYWLMAQDYEQAWNQKFPLQKFAESVYQMRLEDTYSIDSNTFYQAIAVMEREDHRMVLSRQWQTPDGKTQKEWSFRHDKIMEFFLVQPFLGHHPEAIEKRHNHIGDPRFRGIYLLLARLLPPDAALDLREALIQYAADTKDHTVSDSYVQIMRSLLVQV